MYLNVFQRVEHVEKSVSVQQDFEQFVGKQRRVEMKSVGNFVAKTVLLESANQFLLEELCRTQYSLTYFSKQYHLSGRLEKNLKQRCPGLQSKVLESYPYNRLPRSVLLKL